MCDLSSLFVVTSTYNLIGYWKYLGIGSKYFLREGLLVFGRRPVTSLATVIFEDCPPKLVVICACVCLVFPFFSVNRFRFLYFE